MPTPFAACPTEIVESPIDVVWKLLTVFAGWGNFYDVQMAPLTPSSD
jgi:hypothetical protein